MPNYASKSKARKIFLAAVNEFRDDIKEFEEVKGVYLLASKIKNFLNNNPHGNQTVALRSVLSAVYYLYNECAFDTIEECSEDCVGSTLFRAFYIAGELNEGERQHKAKRQTL